MGKIKRFIDRFNRCISSDYTRICKREIYREQYQNKALVNYEQGVDPESESNITVSLTTFGDRLYTVHLTIESLFCQTKKANRIVLWLAESEFLMEDVPIILKNMVKRGLEIKFCSDLKSYKKLVPTLLEEKERNIITVDDDIIYPYDLIERMYITHLKYPKCVIFNKGAEIKLDSNNNVLPYSQWRDYGDFSKPSLMYIGIGVGGIFYPENIFHKDITNVDKFFKYAPHADDLWFKTMTYLNRVECVQSVVGKKILDDKDFLNQFITIEDEQKEKLGKINVVENKNDIQLQNIINEYNLKF